MSTDWSITSPLALLDEWQSPTFDDKLQDLVLLGFGVNLPFLEKVAIRTARVLGARVTVIGDAAHGAYDPVDVRMRSYYTAWAACQGAFHPKLALLIGEREVTAAIGSGNPTMSGWGHNLELWTVLRSGPSGSARGLRQLGEWLQGLPAAVSLPVYAANLLADVASRLTALPEGDDRVQVLHNLREDLLGQLPAGPVEELRLYAPFIDQTGRALAGIFDRFDPGRVVIGLQEHWSSYDGNAILRAAEGRPVLIKFLLEDHFRHGKLLEWEDGNGCYALTGSANLTQSAMTRATAAGGNCELAVLAPVGKSQMPDEGIAVSTAQIEGRRTISENRITPVVLLLGALLTRVGLEVTLARAYDVDVTIETSPDGSPDSWAVIGVVPARRTAVVLPLSESVGAVVRATAVMPGQKRTESPPIFTVDPARCVRRQADDHRPKVQREYTEEEIFTDEELAARFQRDLLRLAEMLPGERTGGSGGQAGSKTTSPVSGEDRWAAYLADCERTIGQALASKLFGSLFQLAPGISSGSGWTIADDPPLDDDSDDEESAGDVPPLITRIRPSERTRWRRWIDRAVASVTPVRSWASDSQAGRPTAPLLIRFQLARLMIQLLGHGVWGLEDDSWRNVLADLTMDLAPGQDEDVPDEAERLAATLAAVCMSLLCSNASLTGGRPADVIAARTWRCVRELVAEADPELADDLLIRPIHPRAVVVNASELEETILQAMGDDPAALVAAGFAERGWSVDYDSALYRVTGPFTNPVSVAVKVATELGQHLDLVLVYAGTVGRWAFVAWRRPDLVLAHVPANTWRVYRIDSFSTPASRFSGGEGLPSTGLVGRPVRLGQSPPPVLEKILAEAGTSSGDLLRRLTDQA